MCERAVAAPLSSQYIVYPILSEKSLLSCEKTVKDEEFFTINPVSRDKIHISRSIWTR